jgi:hypothetical protein
MPTPRFPGHKLWGVNITVPPPAFQAETGYWPQMLAAYYDTRNLWDRWVAPQVNLAASIGANHVGLVIGVGAIFRGEIDPPEWIRRVVRTCRYAGSRGLGFAARLDNPITPAPYDYVESLPWLEQVYRRLGRMDNFWKTTGYGEATSSVNTGFMTRGELDAMISTVNQLIRACAPRVLLGASGYNLDPFSDPSITNHVGEVDYFGMSFYNPYSPNLADVDAFYAANPGAVGKPIFVDEFGSPESAGPTGRTAYVNSVRPFHEDARCAGSAIWAAFDQGDFTGNNWGIKTGPSGSLVPALLDPFTTFSHEPVAISPARRRRA